MSATTVGTADTTVTTGRRTEFAPIPLSRVVRVELRKMFDTRSGFWLIASIVITGLIATIATVAFAPDADLTYYNFAKAVGFPITVILPMVALLSITSEWSQRSGLTTFTYVPSRARVMGAKTVSSVTVAIASMAFAFVVGAVTLDEARDWVAVQHPRSWAPRQLVRLDALPMLPNGKVDRVQLATAASR